MSTIDTWPKRAILADTGPLYATVDPSDWYHDRSKNEAQRLKREGIVVLLSAPILLEAYSLILGRLGIAVAQLWLANAFPGDSLVNPLSEHYVRASVRVRRYSDQTISVTDAVLAELSAQLRFPVWTFDHHFDTMRVSVWR